MSIAIMQPYIFPYIGYFQLVYSSELFIFYDDVNFINKGWVNRNRILANGKDLLITIPCIDASQNKLIKDVQLLNDDKSLRKILTTIQMNYKKAPHYDAIYPLIENIFNCKHNTISEFAIDSVVSISQYLGLQTVFKNSSTSYSNQTLKKGDRLIDICHIEKQNLYINAVGGKEIYNQEQFKSKGVTLKFLVPELHEYLQFKQPFVPWLSVIDILMFNTKEYIVDKILPAFHLD